MIGFAFSVLFLAVLFLIMFLEECDDNEAIKRGNADAIKERIDNLMRPPFNYTRAQAEESIIELRFCKKEKKRG